MCTNVLDEVSGAFIARDEMSVLVLGVLHFGERRELKVLARFCKQGGTEFRGIINQANRF